MPERDIDLIEDIKENNSDESFSKLSERHSNLYYKICQKYSSAFKASGIAPEDVFAEKDYTMWKSVMSFNPHKKCKFSTWLGNYTKYSCLNILKKSSKYVSYELPNENGSSTSQLDKHAIYDPDRSLQDMEEQIFLILEKMKDKRVYKIFKLRYAPEEQKKMTWKNIAKRLDISAQTAINLHSKGLNVISKKIDSDHPDVL